MSLIYNAQAPLSAHLILSWQLRHLFHLLPYNQPGEEINTEPHTELLITIPNKEIIF